MPETAAQLCNAARTCRICPAAAFGFTADSATSPYFKLPPLLGKQGQATILFIGLNPRIDVGLLPRYQEACGDPDAFRKLAADELPGFPPLIGTEQHYNYHRQIQRAVAPSARFHDVAAVTELYLCATPDAGRLHPPTSPCAEKWLARTIAVARPRLIVPIGRMAEAYCRQRWRAAQDVFQFKEADGHVGWVVPAPHPNARMRRAAQLQWACDAASAVIRGREVPVRPTLTVDDGATHAEVGRRYPYLTRTSEWDVRCGWRIQLHGSDLQVLSQRDCILRYILRRDGVARAAVDLDAEAFRTLLGLTSPHELRLSPRWIPINVVDAGLPSERLDAAVAQYLVDDPDLTGRSTVHVGNDLD